VAEQKNPEPGTDDARAADTPESNAEREKIAEKASRQIKKDVRGT
jgi:hypothetical protein